MHWRRRRRQGAATWSTKATDVSADHPSAVSGAFRRPFPEQLAFFRGKLGNLIPTARWDDITREAHDTGFMVAGATKAELLADLAAAVDKAIAEGTGIEAFRRDFRAAVARNGWTGWTGEGSVRGEAWRVKTILRTNAYSSYSAGRFAQLAAGNFPYWVYRHGGSEHPRLWHVAWDGLVLPPDHPFWQTHYPPSDWGCSCYALGASSLAQARRLGGEPDKTLPPGWDVRGAKGLLPGVGKGWDYAPGASVARTVAALAAKIEHMPAPIGAAFGASMRPQTNQYWSRWLDDTRSGRSHVDGFAGVMHQDHIDALTARGQPPVSAEIYMRAGLVVGPKARRHMIKGDALVAATLERLPALLAHPQAVLYDERSGRLIYILNGDASAPQLAVAVNYKPRGSDLIDANVIVSAYIVQIDDLVGRLAGGLLTLIAGSVI